MTKTKSKEREPALFGETEAMAPPKPQTQKPNPQKRRQDVVKIERLPRPTNVLDALATALKNPDVDPTKMRALYELYQETEAKQQFHDALLVIDFPSINRDGKIPVSGGKALRFASFENVHKAVMPLLKRHGFRMSFAPMPGENGQGLVVECRLIRGVYEEKCIVPISTTPASRAMNSQQAIGAAIKYASRYGVMYLLNLRSEASEDRDLDGHNPEIVIDEKPKMITAKQLADLKDVIDDCGVPVATVCAKYEVGKLADLPSALLADALTACRNFKANQAGKSAHG
jgi:ERF superfamily